MTAADLKQIRESLGMTQQEMADRIKISQPRYAMYEGGQRKIPEHIAYLVELTCRVYGGPQD